MATSFRSTLRRLADTPDPAERARLSEVFASQIEIALDAQGGNMQMALWHVEEGISTKIDRLQEQVGNNNTLQSAVLEQVGALRTDMQQSAAQTSMRLKKHDDDIEALTLVVAEHKADHDTRITSLEDYRADMQALRAALAALSARIDSALPTEADQALSTELRGNDPERA